MKKYQLPRAFAEKWVEVLRSEKYEQGFGQLFHRYSDGECRYCCLGVAGKISLVSESSMLGVSDLSDIDNITKPLMPNQLFDEGYYLQLDLMKLNDEEQLTFTEIADWITENVEFI